MIRRGEIGQALQTAVNAVTDDKRDAATVALVKRYAELIDNASPASKYRQPLVALRRALAMLGEREPLAAAEAGDALAKIEDALSAHSVASDLGPKLLNALVALGLAPVARASRGGATGDSGSAPAQRQESTFERLRRQAEERKHGGRAHRASTVDPSAS